MIFIDTETTGVTGESSTYPFLVGVGTIELDHVRVRQFLLPEFSGEWLLLESLNSMLADAEATISYNGKAFDLPLLRRRYRLNSQLTVLDDLHHIDLLAPARRIWKRRLGRCDLQTLERELLNEHRVGDVDGRLIPQFFFEFIRKRSALPLRDVLEHNYHDVVNLARLTVVMAAIAEDPLENLEHWEDVFSLAEFYHKSKQVESASRILEKLLKQDEAAGPSQRQEARLLRAVCAKKMGEMGLAGDYFQQLYQEKLYDPTLIEEYAKFLEHHHKDYQSALDVVENGIRHLENLPLDNQSNIKRTIIPRLQHRHRRLLRKYSDF